MVRISSRVAHVARVSDKGEGRRGGDLARTRARRGGLARATRRRFAPFERDRRHVTRHPRASPARGRERAPLPASPSPMVRPV